MSVTAETTSTHTRPGAERSSYRLSRRDFAIGTAIAVAMAVFFAIMSSGLSLIVTFVPGVAAAWLVFAVIYLRGIALRTTEKLVPLFFIALVIQFLHFAEEFNTGFASQFPVLYGGDPYSAGFFVAFNMVSYAVFTLSALLVFYRGAGFLLMPVLFYVMYGAIGNAITHTWWVANAGQYFPGFYTAQLYWIAGPLLLYRLLDSRRNTVAAIVVLAAVLVSTVTFFMAT